MEVMTVQGVVENGQIRLAEGVRLPERAIVYVVVPEASPVRICSPRLVHPEEAADFFKVVEVIPDADN
jgi:hypothetical protein